MNRRRFLELLGIATAGGAIAYSFPSIIVPKNIVRVRSYSEAVLANNPILYWQVEEIGTPVSGLDLSADFSMEAWSENVSSFQYWPQHWPLALTGEQIMAQYEAARVIFE